MLSTAMVGSVAATCSNPGFADLILDDRDLQPQRTPQDLHRRSLVICLLVTFHTVSGELARSHRAISTTGTPHPRDWTVQRMPTLLDVCRPSNLARRATQLTSQEGIRNSAEWCVPLNSANRARIMHPDVESLAPAPEGHRDVTLARQHQSTLGGRREASVTSPLPGLPALGPMRLYASPASARLGTRMQ